jgi:hypothetical protein
MAHKLIGFPLKESKTKKKLKLPELNGRFGFSFYTGNKEIFLGISISQVEQEVIIKKRFVKNVKAGVRVLQFDA